MLFALLHHRTAPGQTSACSARSARSACPARRVLPLALAHTRIPAAGGGLPRCMAEAVSRYTQRVPETSSCRRPRAPFPVPPPHRPSCSFCSVKHSRLATTPCQSAPPKAAAFDEWRWMWRDPRRPEGPPRAATTIVAQTHRPGSRCWTHCPLWPCTLLSRRVR